MSNLNPTWFVLDLEETNPTILRKNINGDPSGSHLLTKDD